MNIEGVGKESGIRQPDLRSRVDNYRGTGVSFADLMKEKVQPRELKFSSHAEARVKSRGIVVDKEVKEKLNSAAQRVAEKGGRDALLLIKDAAFIVNVPSRTVVTAMDSSSLESQVFTNIDSATVVI